MKNGHASKQSEEYFAFKGVSERWQKMSAPTVRLKYVSQNKEEHVSNGKRQKQ
jgi:hypothetical protein